MCSSSGGQLYEYNFWYNHSALVAVRYAGQDGTLVLHHKILYFSDRASSYNTGRPLAQSDYTRCCINTIVLQRMSTEFLETCAGFK